MSGPKPAPARRKALRPRESAGGGLKSLIESGYFFLPWFFTASIAAAAASRSR